MIFSSIKTKMTSAVFVLVVVLMTATAVTAILYFEEKFKERISSDQFALLAAVSNSIDARIFDALIDLDTLADSLTPAMIAKPHQAQRVLDEWKKHQEFFDNTLFLFSRSGRLIAASPIELNLIGHDYSFRDYFKETLATGKMCVSHPFDSVQQKSHPMIMFTSPVYDAGGKIIAVVGGAIGLRQNHYFRSLAASKLGQNGFLSMYDPNRTVLMHPDSSQLLQKDPPGTNIMMDKALQGFEGTAETVTRNGIPVLRSVKRLKSTDWVLAISYPLTDAYAPLYTARKYFLAGGVSAALLSALLVWALIKYLTAPLLAFARHLEQLPSMEGAQERLVQIGTNDEIGVLAQAFNRMMVELGRRKKSLREQKEFAENLVLNSSLPTFVIDSQHKLLFWNRACEELTGVKAAEIVGTDRHSAAFYDQKRPALADVIIDGSYETLPLQHMSCARSELVTDGWRCEGWYEHKNGLRRYVLLDAAPIYNGQGEVIAAIETIQDITKLKKAEQELGRSRDFYLTLFENFPNLIWRAGIDSKCNYVNRTWLEFTGRTLEQELGDGWSEGVHPEDIEHCLKKYLHAFHARQPFEMEYRLRRHDGKYRWIVDMGRLFNDLDGNFAGYIGSCYDVTDRKQAEQALLESEERYRLLFENNPHPMWLFDMETLSFLVVNNAAVQHYGYSRDEFLAMTIKDIRPPEDVPALLAAVARVTEGIDEAGVWRHIKRDGTPILVEITSHSMQYAGRPTKIVLAHDVTERKQAESEKKALEEQLRQSQKMEAIGTLAGGIAHDFNNILTAIVGYATLLQRKIGEDSPGHRQAGRILDAAERAATLTRSLLAYSRKQISNPEVVELSSIVSGAMHLLRRLIPESIEFQPVLAADKLTIVADPGHLEQILMNLVANARDAMPGAGQLRIMTEMAVLDDAFIAAHGYGSPGSYALLTVADTGAGMDPQTRERIFEPFFTTKEVGKGTGLGLAMVYGIVKQHNGYINCYSEPGHGTVFRIYLPLVEREMEQPLVTASGHGGRGGKETILLVEDDNAVRELTKDLLCEFGYSVIVAIDGQDGVEKFMAHRDSVQLVILDAVMPKMSGKEVYTRIYQSAPDAKVLFVSGYPADVVTGNLLINDGCAVLTKPTRPDELLHKVREILDGF